MNSREADSLQRRWAAYQRLPRLTEHWYWRPGWTPQRRYYTWHLIFDHQTALHRLVTDLQQHLALPALDLVPLEGLHLTTQGVGFTDEITDHDLAAITAAARARLADLAPFRLTLGPVDPDAEGIGLLVKPWEPVEAVRAAIREAIGTVLSTVPEPADGFRPHVTIAYSGAATPSAPIRDVLAGLRELPPATVEIAEASLIALRRDDRVYRWDTIATAALGRT